MVDLNHVFQMYVKTVYYSFKRFPCLTLKTFGKNVQKDFLLASE